MICVNCNVLDKSNTTFDDQGHQETLTIGSCELHGALQTSIQRVNWRNWLSQKSSARRDDYLKKGDTDMILLMFCETC